MRIKFIHIENFKSIKKLDFSPDQTISILIGKNNVGKSNILDALSVLGEVLEERREVFKNRGGYREVVYGKDANLRIVFDLCLIPSEEEIRKLSLKLNLGEANSERFHKIISKGLRYKVQLGLGEHMSNEATLLEEELFIYDNGKEILYALGHWEKVERENWYYWYETIENFVDGLSIQDWQMVKAGGGSPPTSVLDFANHRSPARPEWHIPLTIWTFIKSITRLDPFRESPERGNVLGEYKLANDAKNLPQLLNTLATSKRQIFDAVIKDHCKIIEEISDIRAPIVESKTETYLAMTEHQFGEVEFLWKNISSGTKEILYLLTLLHTAPKGSLLLIEEPELHLHGQAIEKLLNIMGDVAKRDEKQILITTHSPMFVDCVPSEELFIVLREEEGTKVVALRDFKGIVDELFVKAGIPLSYILLTKLPSLILVVEGRDDVKIWSQFLRKYGLPPEENKIRITSGATEGGCEDVITAGKFLQKIRTPIPYFLICDSDRRKEEKETELKKNGFDSKDYSVLSLKEIEDYLLDANAISKLCATNVEEVKKKLTETKGHGKEKLESVLKQLGLSLTTAEIKETLVMQLENIPPEIESVLKIIREKIRKSR